MRASDFITEVNMDAENGAGSVPNNQNVDYMGLRVLMRPSKFLSLARPLPVTPDVKQRIDKFAEYVTQGGAVGQPFMDVMIPEAWEKGEFQEPVRIRGHEGRHRMSAILQAEGDAPVEVHLFFPYYRNKDLTPEWIQEINARVIPEGGTIMRAGPWFEVMQ
jgi:hypothetical protein